MTPITIEDDDVVPINNGVIPLLNDDVEIISPKTEKPVEIQEPEISILTPASAEVEEPPEDPLFPHIATKNSKFEVNLGQLVSNFMTFIDISQLIFTIFYLRMSPGFLYRKVMHL